LKNFSTAILTTVFPSVEKYLPYFLTSLTQQTSQQFDLVVVNDGIANLSILEHYFSEKRIQILKPGNTFVENRLVSMSYAQQEDYENIIFADADDLLSNNRVEKNISLLEKYSIVVNDVDLISEQGSLVEANYFSQSIDVEKEYSYTFIENKNFVGLGNTGLQTKILPSPVQLSSTLKMPDWYFFYTLMRRNQQSVFFTNQVKTLYRQHSENLIGLKEITNKRIELGLQVKLNHYTNLVDEFPDLTQKLQEIDITINYYHSSKSNQENYINRVKALNLSFPLWWEEIKTLKELKIQP
jgi:glycosyltransferase involved in cell wall biosynthesis